MLFRSNLINSMLDGAGQDVKASLFKGRLQDGTPIGSSPAILRWLLGLELQRNPARVITPNSGERMGETVSDEIAKIEKAMRDNRKAYDKDEKMQARYRELLQWQGENKKKAA